MSLKKAKISSLKIDKKQNFQTQNEKIWLLNLDQIEQHTGKILSKEYVNISEVGASTHYFSKGTVLYSKLRPYLNKVVVADEDGFATTELVPINCDFNKINPEYLAYFLRSEIFLTFATNVVAGAKMPRMVMSEFWNYEIPLPTLEEQRRIVSILNKADELRQKRQKAIEKLDQLLQATFIDMFGDPVSNPKGWERKKIKDVLHKLTDGTHHSPPSVDEGIPYITAKHIKEGFIDFYSKPTFVSIEDHKSIYARCDPKLGDVLYIKDGATTGIASINHYDFEFSLLSSVALLRPKPDLLTSDYLETWLNHNTVKQDILQNMGGAAIKRLTLAKIKDLDILLPSLEQQKIFCKIKRQIHKQRETLNNTLNSNNALFQSLQNQAFIGNL